MPADKLGANEGVDKAHMACNRMATEAVTANPLLTNDRSRAQLLANPLRSDAFAEPYMSNQLEDPWAQEFMEYLVRCALPIGTDVRWRSDDGALDITWPGNLGLCPQWADQSIEGDAYCQETVSACLLSLNNAFNTRVEVSMRGEGSTFPANDRIDDTKVISGILSSGTQSQEPCVPGETGADESRDCGWSQGYVGMCQPGLDITLQPETCIDGLMMRVCDGTTMCDFNEEGEEQARLVGSATPCEEPLTFTCRESGSFATMMARAEPAAPAPCSATEFPEPPCIDNTLVIPQAERTLFTVNHMRYWGWQEGAFYGNLFDADAISDESPIQGVEVDGGIVTYNGTEDVYDTACNRVLDDPSDRLTLRLANHDDFIDHVEFEPNTVVYNSAFACSSPSWSEGRAYASKRVCAGDEGQELCAARALDTCWTGANSTTNRCVFSDSLNANNQPDGERDFDECTDDTGRVWSNPITIFIHDPCDILGAGNPFCEDIKRTTTIATGSYHTCVVLTDDTVRCWGRNQFGQLGYGHTDHVGNVDPPALWGAVDIGSTPPLAFNADTDFGEVLAAGASHTCVALSSGRVRCWGANADGQLGYGNQLDIGDNEFPSAAGEIDLGVLATQVSAGERHTCALGTDQTVRCWGYNAFGQLGLGHTQTIGDTETPASAGPVDLGAGVTVKQVASGGELSCALSTADEVYCWGDNGQGQLGLGLPRAQRVGDDETPAAVGPLSVPGTGAIRQLVVGFEFACVLRDEGPDRSRIYCWGDNQYGQLGFAGGVDVTDASQAQAVPLFDPAVDPAPAADLGPIQRITAGQYHVCALLPKALSGRVRCWGRNDIGQLGYENKNHPNLSFQDLIIGEVAVHVSAGAFHTCIITDDNSTVRCWGSNHNWDNVTEYGQLGYGCPSFVQDCTQLIGDDEQPIVKGDVPIL